MEQTRIKVIKEVFKEKENGWKLCFQKCEYEYGEEDGSNSTEKGYRFIWRKPDGRLQGARGQARIPSIGDIFGLIMKAAKEWGKSFEFDLDDEIEKGLKEIGAKIKKHD